MLRFVDRPLGSLLLKAAGANLFIATFAAAILMLRSESPSAAEFFHVYAVSLIYSFCCGGLAWASICFAERRFRRFPRGVRILVVTLLCVLSGAIGQFIGSAICLLTNIDGRGASSVTFSRTLWADWVYAPIERAYMVVLAWVMRHRWVAVAASVLTLLSVGPLFKAVPKGFLPNSDECSSASGVSSPMRKCPPRVSGSTPSPLVVISITA